MELSLHAGNLVSKKAEVEKTYAIEIKENRTFSREEIAKLIVLFAMANKLKLDNLEVTIIINDEQGALLLLQVKFPNDDGSYQVVSYGIKGGNREKPPTCYYHQETLIERSFWDKDGGFEGANIIAEYLEGKWCFTS